MQIYSILYQNTFNKISLENIKVQFKLKILPLLFCRPAYTEFNPLPKMNKPLLPQTKKKGGGKHFKDSTIAATYFVIRLHL